MASSTTLASSASTTTIGRRLIDMKSMLQILNKRKTVTTNHVGQQVVLAVQGNGQFLAKGFQYPSPDGKGMTENQFDRTIYNLQANSQLSMQRAESKAILTEALKAENAGDSATAHDLFNDYLNAVQVSFSVIENAGSTSRKFASGDQVTAVVDQTVGRSGLPQLVVNDVRYKAPVTIAAKAFDVSDLIDIDGEKTV